MQLRTQTEAAAQERSAAASRAEQMQRQLRRAEDEVATLRQERARLLGNAAEAEQQLAAVRAELSSLCHCARLPTPPHATARPRTPPARPRARRLAPPPRTGSLASDRTGVRSSVLFFI